MGCEFWFSSQVQPVCEWSKNGIALGKDAIPTYFFGSGCYMLEFLFGEVKSSENGATFILKATAGQEAVTSSFTLNVLCEYYTCMQYSTLNNSLQ